MESIEIAGLGSGTALLLAQAGDGKVTLSVLNGPERHESVTVRPEWLRPLAAWFAGEAEPVAFGDDSLLPYARRLEILGDAVALMWCTHTEAWLRCSEPYGTARVVFGEIGRMVSSSLVVLLSPEARQQIATTLRRIDAERPVKSAV